MALKIGYFMGGEGKRPHLARYSRNSRNPRLKPALDPVMVNICVSSTIITNNYKYNCVSDLNDFSK